MLFRLMGSKRMRKRGRREVGSGKWEEGRGKREEGRGKREEGIGRGGEVTCPLLSLFWTNFSF
jgi:hypothetical protein